MYSSLMSLTAKSYTAGRIRSSHGASRSPRGIGERRGLGQDASQREQGFGRRRDGELHAERNGTEVEESQLARVADGGMTIRRAS